jgi:hypothetical protein
MPATSDQCLPSVGKSSLGMDLDQPGDTYW